MKIAFAGMEQGRSFGLDDLSPATTAALGAVKDRLDGQPRDWARYTRQAADFHRKNARAWASAAAGEDVTGQIDPEFDLGAHALAMAGAGA